LISALDIGEWSVSRTGRFDPGEKVPNSHWIRSWVEPTVGLDAVEKNLLPCRESNPGRPVRIPHYIYWAIPALEKKN
jgi:hypothetical protein